MDKKDFSLFWQNIYHIMKFLPSPGILLSVGDNKGKDNLMTIGWLQFGFIWSDPAASILVRPSRYTFELMNKYTSFTLNVLPMKYKEQIDFCGKASGSYCDKFKETGLTKGYNAETDSIFVKESEITVSCSTVHTNDIMPENLSDIYLAKFYSNGDYHKIFTGVIRDFKINF
jgi:flavin reductase (DIM6/NTAB) family NADH-FMN oxidoreductase RutF